MTRYGHQQGAARGYNPAKRGRASHHPLMAFVADTRMLAHCWLRPGNASSANNVQAFLEHLEQRKLHHIVALRQTQPLQRALVDASGWWGLVDDQGHQVRGIELCRFAYQAASWGKPRWVVGNPPAHRTKGPSQGQDLEFVCR